MWGRWLAIPDRETEGEGVMKETGSGLATLAIACALSGCSEQIPEPMVEDGALETNLIYVERIPLNRRVVIEPGMRVTPAQNAIPENRDNRSYRSIRELQAAEVWLLERELRRLDWRTALGSIDAYHRYYGVLWINGREEIVGNFLLGREQPFVDGAIPLDADDKAYVLPNGTQMIAWVLDGGCTYVVVRYRPHDQTLSTRCDHG